MATMRQANAALKKLPPTVKKIVQSDVMDVTARAIAEKVESRLPVLTGLLRSAVAWESRPRTVSAVVGIKDNRAFYWKFLEYGTVKMSARPVWRPVAEGEREAHFARLEDAMARSADLIAREAQ